MTRVLIAGGGVAGLALAAHLARRGIEARVFERASRLEEIGAGIQISANAAHALHALGLADALDAVATAPEAVVMRDWRSGEAVNRVPLGAHHRDLHGAPYRVLHRAALQRMLAGALEAAAPGALRLGAAVEGFEDDGRGVTVRLADGTAERGDLLVAADGVRSALRGAIAGTATPRYAGAAVWRATVPVDRLPEGFAETEQSIFMGPGRHIVWYRIDGGRTLNWAAAVERPRPSEESWTATRPWAEMSADFEDWHPDVRRVIEATDRGDLLLWGLFLRDPLPRWSAGRAVLIGDAAHPMLPYIAQGACMAIEDAAVLARALAERPVAQALVAFEALRVPRATRVMEGNLAIARAFHAQTGAAALAAMEAAADVARDRDAWLYSHDPTTVPLPDPAPA